MTRSALEALIYERYSVIGEYPFKHYPTCAVFRHAGNKKWFAAIMRIPIEKLGVMQNREVNIINLKLDYEAMERISDDSGIFPAYHMSKRHWISVLLDGSVSDEDIITLLDASYFATSPMRE